jgi:hypothetical protein
MRERERERNDGRKTEKKRFVLLSKYIPRAATNEPTGPKQANKWARGR